MLRPAWGLDAFEMHSLNGIFYFLMIFRQEAMPYVEP